MTKTPIEKRILNALGERTSAQYHALMREVFPPDEYPNAWRSSNNGGPPGCAMTFGAAIRRLGGTWHGAGSQRMVYVPKK